jgi:glycosyltransferase involved in cell wall biosynthesis
VGSYQPARVGKPTKLFVVQPYIPRYRTAFYESARDRLADLGIDMTIVVGRRNSDRGDGDEGFPCIELHDHLETRTNGTVRHKSLRRLRAGRNDLLLLEQAIKNLDAYPALVRQHFTGPSVGLWGHGKSYSSRQSSVLAEVKQWETRRAAWFFAYTQGGADTVAAHGFPRTRITLLNNSIDTTRLRAALDALTVSEITTWASEHEIDPTCTGLFLGGIDERKDVGYLVEVAREARRLNSAFTMLFGGSGTGLAKLRRLEAAGAPIKVLGRLDGKEKALALRNARALAIPSQIGLVAIDSFVAGVPIVTRRERLHGPEAEYLDDHVDSLWLPREARPGQFARELLDLIGHTARLPDMSAACRQKSLEYSLDSMVESFAAGVAAWSEVRRVGL